MTLFGNSFFYIIALIEEKSTYILKRHQHENVFHFLSYAIKTKQLLLKNFQFSNDNRFI